MRESLLQLIILQTLQISLLILVAEVVHRLLGSRWPRFRYAMWLAILIKCLVPPVMVSPTGVFSWSQLSLAETAAAPATGSLGWTETTSTAWADWMAPFAPVGFAIWMMGLLLLAASWTRAYVRFVRMTKDQFIDDTYHRMTAVLQSLATSMGMRRLPRLVLTEHDFGPAMIGLIRPTIVIPRRLVAELSEDQVRPLLAHELVHVKRFDSLVGFLQMVTAAMWWFNPLVWLAIRRLTSTLEMRVDDRTVAEMEMCPKSYASSLLSALELLCRPIPIPGSMGLITCRLTGSRIRNLLRPTKSLRTEKSSTLMVAALCLMILPGRGLSVPSDWLFKPIPCGQASLDLQPVEADVTP